jgi:hypothetical protein
MTLRLRRAAHVALALSAFALTPLAAPLQDSDSTAPAAPAAAETNEIEGWIARARDEAKAALGQDDVMDAQKAELEARIARFEAVLANPRELRVQVVLGIPAEVDGKRTLLRKTWRAGAEYFYPASAIKPLGAAVALERMHELQRKEAPTLSLDTPLAFWGERRGGPILATDADNLADGKLTLRHLIREALIVSDNESFNRLYEFCGQTRLNESLWKAGIGSARILHRLSVRMSLVDNRRTPAIELRLAEGPITLPEESGTLTLAHVEDRDTVLVGKARIEADKLVPGPMSFIARNGVRLVELQTGLARIVAPELSFEGQPFALDAEDRQLLLDALSTFPGDSKNPKWDRTQYPDDYAKFFLGGATRVIPRERLVLHNKVGLAYGFTTDNAYIGDRASGKGFFLAATIYADSDGTVDDGKYDYETLAIPFLNDLAEICAREVLGGK